jgi:hypothetical protein
MKIDAVAALNKSVRNLMADTSLKKLKAMVIVRRKQARDQAGPRARRMA